MTKNKDIDIWLMKKIVVLIFLSHNIFFALQYFIKTEGPNNNFSSSYSGQRGEPNTVFLLYST